MSSTETARVGDDPRREGLGRRFVKTFGPIAKPVSGTRLFPLWAILGHTGRTSGKRYATPIVALPGPGGFLIPLPFGGATQWAKNLLAAGGGSLRSAGRDYKVDQPQILDLDEVTVHLPRLIRFISGRLGLRSWVLVRRVAEVSG